MSAEYSTSYQPVSDPTQGLSRNELVGLVDEQNTVVGSAPRWRVRKENLRHRSTFIFVRMRPDPAVREDWKLHRYIVQKRTLVKDYCPGFYDACTGGVMVLGETYEENARRELEEELGIPVSPENFTPLFHFLHEDPVTKVWGGAFLCDFGGNLSDLRLQPEEVDSVYAMTLGEIQERAAKDRNFTPDSMHAVENYVAMLTTRAAQ